MDLIAKAKSIKGSTKPSRNAYSDEEWELAKAFLSEEVTIRQVIGALGRKSGAQCVYPWVLVLMREAIKKGKCKLL